MHAGGQEFDPPRLHHLVLISFHMHFVAYGCCQEAIVLSSLIIQRLINYIDIFGVVSRIVIPNSLEFGLSNAGSSPLLTLIRVGNGMCLSILYVLFLYKKVDS